MAVCWPSARICSPSLRPARGGSAIQVRRLPLSNGVSRSSAMHLVPPVQGYLSKIRQVELTRSVIPPRSLPLLAWMTFLNR
jgi:hypothetical protein